MNASIREILTKELNDRRQQQRSCQEKEATAHLDAERLKTYILGHQLVIDELEALLSRDEEGQK